MGPKHCKAWLGLVSFGWFCLVLLGSVGIDYIYYRAASARAAKKAFCEPSFMFFTDTAIGFFPSIQLPGLSL